LDNILRYRHKAGVLLGALTGRYLTSRYEMRY